jgi:hypothetical protein
MKDMFVDYKFFQVIAASLHYDLNPGSEPPAVPGHGVPVEDAHHLLDLLHQGAGSL